MEFTEQGFRKPIKTRERLARLMKDHPDLSAKEAADRLQLSRVTSIYPLAKQIGVCFTYSRLGYVNLATLLGKRAKGATLRSLSTEYDLTIQGVSSLCRRYGLASRQAESHKRRLKAEDAIFNAVLAADTYTDFQKNYPAQYLRATRWGLLEDVKEKFEW